MYNLKDLPPVTTEQDEENDRLIDAHLERKEQFQREKKIIASDKQTRRWGGVLTALSPLHMTIHIYHPHVRQLNEMAGDVCKHIATHDRGFIAPIALASIIGSVCLFGASNFSQLDALLQRFLGNQKQKNGPKAA